MYEALEYLERQGELRGVKQTEIKNTKKMIMVLRKHFISEELILEEIKEQFSLSDEKARAFMQ